MPRTANLAVAMEGTSGHSSVEVLEQREEGVERQTPKHKNANSTAEKGREDL